jgi:hypothetical protein
MHGTPDGRRRSLGDVAATGKNLTRAQVSSRSPTVSPATVATENSVVPRFRHQGLDPGSKEIRRCALTVRLVVENRN